jgi:hypothetical protein
VNVTTCEYLAVRWRIIMHNGLRETKCDNGSWLEMIQGPSRWRALDWRQALPLTRSSTRVRSSNLTYLIKGINM